MFKPYYEQGKTDPVLMISGPSPIPDLMETRGGVTEKGDHPAKLYNSEVIADLRVKLLHLALEKRKDLAGISDIPKQTIITYHDVEVRDVTPIKQHPYQVSPRKSYIEK